MAKRLTDEETVSMIHKMRQGTVYKIISYLVTAFVYFCLMSFMLGLIVFWTFAFKYMGLL